MTDIYPKYRVVRRHDEYHVEELRCPEPFGKWETKRGFIATIFSVAEAYMKYSKEKEAISKAAELSEKSKLEHKRKTDTAVVWGPEP